MLYAGCVGLPGFSWRETNLSVKLKSLSDEPVKPWLSEDFLFVMAGVTVNLWLKYRPGASFVPDPAEAGKKKPAGAGFFYCCSHTILVPAEAQSE